MPQRGRDRGHSVRRLVVVVVAVAAANRIVVEMEFAQRAGRHAQEERQLGGALVAGLACNQVQTAVAVARAYLKV